MPHINSTKFGAITIDGKKYGQVLLVGDCVQERDKNKLKELFGTSHKIGEWETIELLKDNPEIIIIGTGQDGVLEADKWFLDKMDENKVEVSVAKTPDATILYNDHVKNGKRVNALIHTTC